jgi:hypothetical protein
MTGLVASEGRIAMAANTAANMVVESASQSALKQSLKKGGQTGCSERRRGLWEGE